MADRVRIDGRTVQKVVARAKKGQKQGEIAEELSLKGHVVKEILRAKELIEVSPERLERAKAMVDLWTGKTEKAAVADPTKAAKNAEAAAS